MGIAVLQPTLGRWTRTVRPGLQAAPRDIEALTLRCGLYKGPAWGLIKATQPHTTTSRQLQLQTAMASTNQGLHDLISQELGSFIQSKSATFAVGGIVPIVRSPFPELLFRY